MPQPAFRRILLKLSGEALMGEDSYGINTQTLAAIVGEVKAVVDAGVQVAVVIGGGNIFRGVSGAASGMDRPTADYMGMLATVINSMALADSMRQAGLAPRIQSALALEQVAEPYIRGKALRYLEEGKVVIFGAGTGNPFFTTDTAASLRAIEIEADLLLKATKVNGVYTDDPFRNPKAQRYTRLSYEKVLADRLGVMDATAIVMCRDNGLPLRVFNLFNAGDLIRIVDGEEVGTLVADGLQGAMMATSSGE